MNKNTPIYSLLVNWVFTISELGLHFVFSQSKGNQQLIRKFPIYSINKHIISPVNQHFTTYLSPATKRYYFPTGRTPSLDITPTLPRENIGNEERSVSREREAERCQSWEAQREVYIYRYRGASFHPCTPILVPRLLARLPVSASITHEAAG